MTIFAACFHKKHGHVVTTKRYARLAKGNVRNFQERTARTVYGSRYIAWAGLKSDIVQDAYGNFWKFIEKRTWQEYWQVY